jgi:hypothetical protein
MVGALVAASAVAWFLAYSERREQDRLIRSRGEVTIYLDEVEPLAKQGGEVVALGLKPGITDLRQGRARTGPDRANAWLADLEAVRVDWARRIPPEKLSPAHDLFIDGLDGYIEVATVLSEAASLPVARRGELLDRAVTLGESSDDIWDRAAGIVQMRLHELQMNTVSWLPGS